MNPFSVLAVIQLVQNHQSHSSAADTGTSTDPGASEPDSTDTGTDTATDPGTGDPTDTDTDTGTTRAAAPTFSPPGGLYNTDQSVSLATTTPDAKIYYTTDNTEPAPGVTGTTLQYDTPIQLNGEETYTIKAVGVKNGLNDSVVATGTFAIFNRIRTESFLQDMKTSIAPTLLAEAYDGSVWKIIPTTGVTLTWTDATTLTVDPGWIFLPENTQLRFTLSNLYDAEGNPESDEVDNFTTGVLKGYEVSDTGQTSCYYISGSSVMEDGGCSQTYSTGNTDYPYGQDAHYIDIPRSRSFTGPEQHATYTDDHTTTDTVTGLTWKTCSEGLTDSTCTTGTATTFNWYYAINACAYLNNVNGGAGYAGRSDWRLPKQRELETLVNYGIDSPTIDTAYFPASAATYWSSTSIATDPASSWSISLFDGTAFTSSKIGSRSIRCVSGPDSFVFQSFSESGGTIKDNSTGLVWQKCSANQNNDTTCSGIATTKTRADALNYCEELNQGSRTDWRLPNINELKSIIDYGKQNPSIDSDYFPGTVANDYWTSTEVSLSGTNFYWSLYSINFDTAKVEIRGYDGNYYTRCVAGP